MKLAIFDMDGVIVDTMEQHGEINKIVAKEMGLEFTRDMHNEFKGKARAEVVGSLLKYAGKEVNKESVEYYSKRKDDHFDTFFGRVNEEHILEGILPLIEDLEKDGVRLTVASGSVSAHLIMEKVGLSKRFEYIADNKIIKKGKPDPEIIQQVLDYCGIAGKDTIGIEDGASGLTAMNAAGLFTVGVGNKEELKEADLNFLSTKDLDYSLIKEAYEKWRENR